jgi:hypothetical protein
MKLPFTCAFLRDGKTLYIRWAHATLEQIDSMPRDGGVERLVALVRPRMAWWADCTLGRALRELGEFPRGRLVLSEYELAEFELRRFIRFHLRKGHANAEQIVNKLLDTKFLRNMLRHWVETEGLRVTYEAAAKGEVVDLASRMQELEFYEERDRLRRPAEELDVNQAEYLATPF